MTTPEGITSDEVTEDEGAALLADPATDADDPDPAPEPNSEAAKYRRRLRETEGERDALKGRVEAFQRREAERVAAGVLRDAADLWGSGVELADLLTEGGDVDAKRVTERAEALAQSKPHLRQPEPMPVKRGQQQLSGGGDPSQDHPKLSWDQVLKGRTR